jgi:hypothetical protein
MPQPIYLKRSSTPGKVPLVSDLASGELALNFADGRLFFKTSGNAIANLNDWSYVASKPTNLAGYGITDAQALSPNLTSVAGLSTSATGLVKLTNGVASLDSAAYLTGNQSITFTGDATGSGTTAVTLTLGTSGVTAGSYGNAASGTIPQFTVDAKGRVTAASSVALTPAAIGAIPTSQLGANSGVATLDASGKLNNAQIPSSLVGGLNYQGTWNATTNTPTLVASVGTKGWYYIVSVAGSTNLNGATGWSIGDLIVFNGTTWHKVEGGSPDVSSVAGKTGAVTLVAADVGLGNVTNVAQLAATQTLAITGDATATATGLSTGTIAVTLANSGVTAGTYNTATQNVPMTVDAKGRVTAVGAALTITPAWASITGKPTTLSGYGITDALTNSEAIDGGTY